MRRGAAAVALSVAGACMPYTVGSTARTTPPGALEASVTAYAMPNAIPFFGDSIKHPTLGADVELRHGLDESTDVGFRLVTASGVSMTVKRRIDSEEIPVAAALMIGAGVMKWGEYGYGEASLLFSGDEEARFQPYGGFRGMGVLPFRGDGSWKEPTTGAFLGVRIRDLDLVFMPEIGVFYDRSALDRRGRNWVVVPGFTIASRPTRRRVRR